jgi:hypothetical protein
VEFKRTGSAESLLAGCLRLPLHLLGFHSLLKTLSVDYNILVYYNNYLKINSFDLEFKLSKNGKNAFLRRAS